jgi:AcrR family transcriptional regulator
MPRIVKEYAVRRDEILNSAQRLIYTKGYEPMAIQDILDELNIAKGTFYHYFESKQELLEAVITRLLDQTMAILQPIADDPSLSTRDKFHTFFDTLARWKTSQKSLLLELTRIWYTDQNAIVRQKMHAESVRLVTPLLNSIIHQGIADGVFNVPHPDLTGGMILALAEGLNDAVAWLMLSNDARANLFVPVQQIITAYNVAFERVLGAAPGFVSLTDDATLHEWFEG